MRDIENLAEILARELLKDVLSRQKSCDGDALYAALQDVMAEQDIPLGKLYMMDRQYCATLFKSFTQFGRTTQTIKLPLIMKRKPFEELVKKIYHAEL